MDLPKKKDLPTAVKEKKEEIIRRYSAGESARSIADNFHVAHWDILNCLLRCGVKIRTEDRKGWALNDVEKAYMQGLISSDKFRVEKVGDGINIDLQTDDEELVKLLEYMIAPYSHFTVLKKEPKTY